MSGFKEVYSQIKSNRQRRLEGKLNCIPWRELPKFSTLVPGIQQRRYYICTANSKVGKTQMCDFLFVYQPYEFISKNNTDLDVKIIYNSLEVSKEEKLKTLWSYKLFKDHGITIDSENMGSIFENYILDETIERRIGEYEEFTKQFLEKVTYIDNVRNPFGIYQNARKYAESVGSYYDKDGFKIPMADIQKDRSKYSFVIDTYKPNNPNEYVINITDHVSLLTPEKGDSLHRAIQDFSSNYCMGLRSRFGMTVVNVQQQASDQEKQQFTLMTGKTVVDKLRPSPDGLGDNKMTQRDCDVIFGLFAPYRYKIPDYAGYDITKLQDNHRELLILNNRHGGSFKNAQLYFNGASNYFSELPSPNEIDYEKYGKKGK